MHLAMWLLDTPPLAQTAPIKRFAVQLLKPNVVHVLYNGRIVKTDGPQLAKEIEKRGYDWIKAEVDEK